MPMKPTDRILGPAGRDGRVIAIVDARGARLGFVVTDGFGVVAHSARGRVVPFASWLAALAWMVAEGATR